MEWKLSEQLKGKQEMRKKREKEEKKMGVCQSCVFEWWEIYYGNKKKSGADWFVDLKLSKKWKGKWEKKDGFCQVVDLK